MLLVNSLVDRVMEPETIDKNGASSKSHTSRANFFKKVCFALLLVTSYFSVNAQDLITLRNGDQITAKVTEITLTEIKYKRFDNLEGPTITIPRSSVFLINYENGTREVINPLPTTTRELSVQPRNNTGLQRGYKGIAELGSMVGDGVGLKMFIINGYQINPYFSLVSCQF